MNCTNRERIKMSNGSDEADYEREGGLALEEARPQLRPPRQYRVVLLNDDYTPMDFVVLILQKFFGMDLEKATKVMLTVHTQGKGVCGVFTKDIAETKAAQVNHFSQQNEHPLLCNVEVEND